MTFYQYLRKQKDRDDITGDLARDAMHDPDIPHKASIEKWAIYLRYKGDHVKEAFRESIQEYLNELLEP